MSFSYSKEEMTVTLNYDQFNKKWEAYTNIPKYRDKMIRAGWTLDDELPEDHKEVQGRVQGYGIRLDPLGRGHRVR